jgi:predicted DNA-binding protein (UPF0251 family)
VPRPKKPRFVSGYPTLTAFVPEGVPITGEVFLSVEELEAVRLSDFEGLDQEAAANLMEVSRQTYGRILAHARSVISEALVTGKALRVEGGDYEFRGMRRRRGRGGGRGQALRSGSGDGRGQGRGRGWQS